MSAITNSKNYFCSQCFKNNNIQLSWRERVVRELKSIGTASIEVAKTHKLQTILTIAALTVLVAAIVFTSIASAGTAPLIVASLVVLEISLLSAASAIVLHLFNLANLQNRRYKACHSEQMPKNKEVALIVETTDDHNGAFEMTDHIKELEKSYHVVFKKVSSNTDIIKAVNDTVVNRNKIKMLWIRGHGNPISIRLGPGDSSSNFIAPVNAFQLTGAFNKLEPDAPIVLDSCSTGKVKKPSMIKPATILNIAYMIAVIAKNHLVIAPKEDVSQSQIKITSKKPLKVQIWGHGHSGAGEGASSLKGFKKVFKEFLTVLLPQFAEDIAVRYRYTPTALAPTA